MGNTNIRKLIKAAATREDYWLWNKFSQSFFWKYYTDGLGVVNPLEKEHL